MVITATTAADANDGSSANASMTRRRGRKDQLIEIGENGQVVLVTVEEEEEEA